jgi:hypothetical protein
MIFTTFDANDTTIPVGTHAILKSIGPEDKFFYQRDKLIGRVFIMQPPEILCNRWYLLDGEVYAFFDAIFTTNLGFAL